MPLFIYILAYLFTFTTAGSPDSIYIRTDHAIWTFDIQTLDYQPLFSVGEENLLMSAAFDETNFYFVEYTIEDIRLNHYSIETGDMETLLRMNHPTLLFITPPQNDVLFIQSFNVEQIDETESCLFDLISRICHEVAIEGFSTTGFSWLSENRFLIRNYNAPDKLSFRVYTIRSDLSVVEQSPFEINTANTTLSHEVFRNSLLLSYQENDYQIISSYDVTTQASFELLTIPSNANMTRMTLSPDNSSLGYIFDGQLFINDLASGEIQITIDSVSNYIWTDDETIVAITGETPYIYNIVVANANGDIIHTSRIPLVTQTAILCSPTTGQC